MKIKRKYKAVEENVKGDFYVEDGCCTMCGAPNVEAPELFGGFDENSKMTNEHCFVKKQPESIQELEKMMNAMAVQELICIRYCGKDRKIKEKIRSIGEHNQIDW